VAYRRRRSTSPRRWGTKLPLFIGVVVLLSALLLMIVFRSLVDPIAGPRDEPAQLGASLGRESWRSFQWGWFGSLFGVPAGPDSSRSFP